MKKKTIRFLISLLIMGLCMSGGAQAEDEYRLKAAFLSKFTMYFDWPADSEVNNPAKPFVIAVIGANPFGSYLDDICSITKVKDKEIKVFYISRVEEIAAAGCNLLFIAGTDDKKLAEILTYTGNKPILTVSDGKDFAEKGVHINFLIIKDKVNFEINPRAVRDARLVMNYHLLGLAARVIKGVNGEKKR